MLNLWFRFYGRIATDPNAHETETLDAIKENMQGLEGKYCPTIGN